MRRGPRLLGRTFALWDVRDVEAHVRVLVDARLAEWGARLDPDLYDDLLGYLLGKCWELSGLDGNGRPRVGWWARAVLDVEETDDGQAETLGWYATYELAEAVGVAKLNRDPRLKIELVEGPPPGAYDPTLGLTFSTYSRRILTARIVDWYRQTFGDARYQTRIREISLEAAAERYDAAGEAPEQFLDALMPGDDPTEEVLTRVALGR